LSAYVRGELPPDVRSALQAHLRECPACLASLTALDPIAAALVQSQEPPAPQGFAMRVMAAARSRRKPVVAGDWDLLHWWRMTPAPMRAAAAAMLVAGLAAGLATGWTARPATRQAQDAQAVALADAVAVYHLDYFGDAPDGSLADGYVALLAGRNGEGR
jgi:anti-sigma factor RsiW